MRLCEVEAGDGPAVAFLWGSRLPDAALTVVYGEGATGKTTLCLGLGVAMAAGLPFLGEETVQRPVLYVDAELTGNIVADIARKIARGMGLDEVPRDLHYHRLGGSLATSAGMGELRRAVEESGAGLVVIDSFEAATPALEAFSLAEVGNVLDGLARLGVAIVIIDHVAKSGGPDFTVKRTPYGAAVKLHRSRAGFLLRKRGADGGVLSCEKASYTAKLPALTFRTVFDGESIRFEVGEVVVGRRRETLDTAVVNILTTAVGPLTVERIAELAGTSKKSIANRLSVLRASGQVERVAPGQWTAKGKT